MIRWRLYHLADLPWLRESHAIADFYGIGRQALQRVLVHPDVDAISKTEVVERSQVMSSRRPQALSHEERLQVLF